MNKKCFIGENKQNVNKPISKVLTGNYDNDYSDEGNKEVDYRIIIKPRESFSLKMDCRSRAASAVQDEK